MLQKITIGEKEYFYCQETRLLFKENNRDYIIQTKWFPDEELREYHRKTREIHEQIKKDC
jgi:hypothetical protein